MSHKIESIYVKVVLPKNVIFGYIFRHPDCFSTEYLRPLLKII